MYRIQVFCGGWREPRINVHDTQGHAILNEDGTRVWTNAFTPGNLLHCLTLATKYDMGKLWRIIDTQTMKVVWGEGAIKV